MKLFLVVSWIQGMYFLLTGIWPWLHIKSFMAVTGPKTDIWLVQTVGMLAAVIGITLLIQVVTKKIPTTIGWLGLLSALGFGFIDIWFAVVKDIISDIYLVDFGVEVGFGLVWGYFLVSGSHRKVIK